MDVFGGYPVVHLVCSLIISAYHTEASESASEYVIRNISAARSAPQVAVSVAAGRHDGRKGGDKGNGIQKKNLPKIKGDIKLFTGMMDVFVMCS